jgi:hypothetical protein
LSTPVCGDGLCPKLEAECKNPEIRGVMGWMYIIKRVPPGC